MESKSWTLEERCRAMLSNWVQGPIPEGLVKDVILFAEMFGGPSNDPVKDIDGE